MMRPPSSLSPPGSAEELLTCLRSARLLSKRRARALGRRWTTEPDPGGCPARVRELLAAGVLTRYQAARVLEGRARRLRLGPYRILDRLGIGGMGHVYKAEHLWMRRIVALKVIARLPPRETSSRTPPPGGQPSRRELIARFRREVRSAARMRHPNIVTAFDAGVARGFLYLVMEYIDGIDLGRFVAENGALPIPLACEAVRQAALALQYAHDRGLVHRDIKPDNLLLTWPDPNEPTAVGSLPSLPDGTSGEGAAVIKLLDLGLAVPTCLPAGQVAPAGTPDYMAPEQARGHGPVDGRSDLYSLGCTFYYLLTGRVPYPGGTCTEKLVRHGVDVPGAIGDLRPDVPPAIVAVVERLMAKNPEERYPGPAAVAAVLWGLAMHGWNPAPADRRTPKTARQALEIRAALPEGASPDRMVSDTPSVPSLPELPAIPATTSSPTERRRLPGPGAVMAALLAGPLLTLALFGLNWSNPRSADQAPASRSVLPFGVERLGKEFVSLAEAIAAAQDGDTVTIRGPEPHQLPPTDLGNKALTLRAVGVHRPLIEPKDARANGPWQALLATSRSLTLVGLKLVTSGDAPLVAGTGATLHLTDCQVTASGGGAAVVVRGGELHLHSCRVRTAATALASLADAVPSLIEVADTTVAVTDPAGVAVAVWAPEASRPVDVNLILTGNVIAAGRVASFRALCGRVQVEANRNDLTFQAALASFSEYARGTAWRRSTIWKGRDNRCHAAGCWLLVDGQPAGISDATGWQQLWQEPPAPGSHQAASTRPASHP